MNFVEAYARRKSALHYLQHVCKNAASFDPQEREKRVAAARTSYQNADALYRKLANETTKEKP